jgi:hypothetical protein
MEHKVIRILPKFIHQTLPAVANDGGRADCKPGLNRKVSNPPQSVSLRAGPKFPCLSGGIEPEITFALWVLRVRTPTELPTILEHFSSRVFVLTESNAGHSRVGEKTFDSRQKMACLRQE